MSYLASEELTSPAERRRMLARARRLAKKAEDLASEGKIREAIVCQAEVVDLRPDDPVVHHRLGMLYREVFCYDPAVDAFRCAAALDPEHSDPKEALIDTLLDAARYLEAIDEAKAYLKNNSRSIFARFALSVAYFQEGRIQQALDMTAEIAVLDPYDFQNYLRRASLFQSRGQYALALSAYLCGLELLDVESPIYHDAWAAIDSMDEQQIQIILLLASEDGLFRLKLQHDLEPALSERGFALSRDGMHRLQAFADDDLFAAAAELAGGPAPVRCYN